MKCLLLLKFQCVVLHEVLVAATVQCVVLHEVAVAATVQVCCFT